MGARFFFLAFVCLVLLPQTLSCAPRGQGAMPHNSALAQNAVDLSEKEGEFFRHRVQLALPGQEAPFAFDGLMILTEGEAPAGENRRIQLAGLGGMGLRLFSLFMDKENLYLEYLHPSLARIPRIEEYIARCVRVVWLGVEAEKDREQVQFSAETPWARRIAYTHAAPEFTVEIRLVEHRHRETGGKETATEQQNPEQVQP